MEKLDLTEDEKSDLFVVFSPAHCRMEKREGGAIVEVYIIFFCVYGGSAQTSWGKYYPFQDITGAAYHVPHPGTAKRVLEQGGKKKGGERSFKFHADGNFWFLNIF